MELNWVSLWRQKHGVGQRVETMKELNQTANLLGLSELETLVACTRLCKQLCPSVGPSVGPLLFKKHATLGEWPCSEWNTAIQLLKGRIIWVTQEKGTHEKEACYRATEETMQGNTVAALSNALFSFVSTLFECCRWEMHEVGYERH